MNIRRCLVIGAVGLVACFTARSAWAQQIDVIRGRITGPDSLAVPNVNVRVISYSGGIAKTTKTDKNGRFQVTYPNGEGDYWVELTAIGYVPKRFEIKRIAEEEMLIADSRLTSTVNTLGEINVTAPGARAIAGRNDAGRDISGTERTLNNAGLPPDVAGNLAAMAALLPGIQLIPGMDGAADMFSALGLSGDQNNTTFNGLGSALEGLPRDASTSASVRTTSYDVSQGGFSGAQISIYSQPGNNWYDRRMSGAGRGPETEWASDAAEEQGAKNTYLSLGGRLAGPVVRDRHFYSGSYQFDRTFSDLQSLMNTSSVGLNAAGVARDSANRLLDILQTAGVPARVSSVPSSFTSDQIRLQGNVDMTPQSSGANGHAFNLSTAATYTRTQPAGSNLVYTVPAFSNESDRWGLSALLRHTNYFWFGVLSRTSIGVAANQSNNQPFLHMPGGNVRVNSTLEDGRSSIRNLTFGGNPQGSTGQSSGGIELANQMTWYSANNKHVLKLSSNIRHERYTSDQWNNRLGSFSFNSLADLETGRPSSFSRTLFSPEKQGSQITSSIALGDAWRPTPNVQVQYGVRADGNRFSDTPTLNPALASAFGIRNDRVPNRVYISPRVGFQWIYGTLNQIAFVPGAARPERALIRGGIGVFQNIRDAQLIRGPMDATGLPSSMQQISCVGDAAPAPDWDMYRNNPSAIPTACADGSAGTVFATGSPNVNMFDRDYGQQRSLRTSLGWGGAILDNRFMLGAAITHSLNFYQPGSIDLNQNTDVRFTLDDEAGRPVFANSSAIVPTTGAIALRDSRIESGFNRVTLQRSDLRSEARQLNLNLRPVSNSTLFRWGVDYTLQDLQELYRGFGGGGFGGGFGGGNNTVGNPFDRHWDRALNGRHTFALNVSYNAWDLIRFSAVAQIRSPARYTPMVAGDVNGDGSGGNDRAFVFDPAAANDPAVGEAIQTLLNNGSPAVRKCLSGQVGRLADRGSCSGPWTFPFTNVSISFNPQKIGLPQRLSLTLNLTNPLLLADLIAHGSDDLRGWGQNIQPDASLLFVRGFDPATQRFKYEVNQRFGSTRPNQSSGRALSYLSINIGMDIGPPRERQALTQRLDIGRNRPGTKPTAALLKSLGSSTIPNPMAMILTQPDSLKLTRRQADSLASLSRRFTLYADSLWTPVARYLETLPDDYDQDEAYVRYRRAREKSVDYLLAIVPAVKDVLTPTQRRMLPSRILDFLDPRVLNAIRSSTANVTGINPMMGR